MNERTNERTVGVVAGDGGASENAFLLALVHIAATEAARVRIYHPWMMRGTEEERV